MLITFANPDQISLVAENAEEIAALTFLVRERATSGYRSASWQLESGAKGERLRTTMPPAGSNIIEQINLALATRVTAK